MGALPTRELRITYGGFTVGGDQSARILRDIHMLEQTYETATVEYRFTVKQNTRANFIAECAAVEAAFSIPFQDLTILVEGSTLKSYSHANSTGFNGEPTITKRGENSDSVRTRTYTVRVRFGLPALVVSNGRRITKTDISVSYSPARRRTVSISGEYTAQGGTASRAVYEAAIASFATGVLNGLTGTYKLLDEPTTVNDDADKVIRFSINYEEIIFTGVGSSIAELRKETCVISRNKVGPGDTPLASRLVTLTVNYEAWFDKTVTTDLTGKWSSLLPRIVGQASTILTGGAIALVDENPQFDLVENKITATLTLVGSTQGGLIENRVTTEIETQSGLVFTPVWNRGAYDRYIYQGPATQRKTVTITQKSLSGAGGGNGAGGGPGVNNGGPGASFGGGIVNNGPGSISLPGGGSVNIFGGPMTGAQITALVNAVLSDGDPSGGGGGGAGGGGGGGGLGNFYPVSNSVAKTPLRLGIGNYFFDVTETTIVTVWERADPVGIGAGAGSVASGGGA